ncbi:uncharacterized protein KGF55_001559 [Candida pseudojiufengensis]|uniref:uncharacterized protein n=1 Tax=Candida pseudojiufengensis TaxID=497109 RepID=UPI0022258429|nr:uncharacterized protein KGF55_001559 [Candida pseudojiufengensis]KAI5965338.1 hypothetical protein KGF55_001559 [Candida pseudojiufengensis]
MPNYENNQSNNKISENAKIKNIEAVKLASNITIAGDVVIDNESLDSDQNFNIQIGKYTFIRSKTKIISPCHIGSFVIIGLNCAINSKLVGNRVIIEDNVETHQGSIIYDCCIIKRGSIIPPKYIIPPYSEVSGKPGENFLIKPLNNCYKEVIESEARKLNILGSD